MFSHKRAITSGDDKVMYSFAQVMSVNFNRGEQLIHDMIVIVNDGTE